MTYWRYWELSGPPFTGDTTQPLFKGATVEEAIARIEFLVSNRRNVGLLLGASGVGKSSILRHIAGHPPVTEQVPNLRVMRTSMLGMTGGELCTNLVASLTGNRRIDNPAMAWNNLCDYFNAANREDIQTVLLLDDAESSSAAAEADLCRMLSMSFPLTVIFAVESQLMSGVSPGLLERTELQIELPGWEISQTGEFLGWTTSRLNRETPIFTDAAVARIQQLSQGITRRIVQIADLALVAGAVAQLASIDADCIDQVAWELPKSNAA